MTRCAVTLLVRSRGPYSSEEYDAMVEVELEVIGRRDDAFVRLAPDALRDRVRLQRVGRRAVARRPMAGPSMN